MAAHCGKRQVALLQELRFMTGEVSYEEARRMPTEVRRWWIRQVQQEHEDRVAEQARNKK